MMRSNSFVWWNIKLSDLKTFIILYSIRNNCILNWGGYIWCSHCVPIFLRTNSHCFHLYNKIHSEFRQVLVHYMPYTLVKCIYDQIWLMSIVLLYELAWEIKTTRFFLGGDETIKWIKREHIGHLHRCRKKKICLHSEWWLTITISNFTALLHVLLSFINLFYNICVFSVISILSHVSHVSDTNAYMRTASF